MSQDSPVTYPKIETLLERRDDFTVNPEKLRLPEFALIDRWLVTEKIDGTNIRIICSRDKLTFGGRTERAQIPAFLLDHLIETFTLDTLIDTFPDLHELAEVVLHGEGYGAKIQKGGGNYREGVSFRLFDVTVTTPEGFTWWLNWNDIEDIADKLKIKTVPKLSSEWRTEEIIQLVRAGMSSATAHYENHNKVTPAEGVVCRTEPLLFTRTGARLMWKLKTKDFVFVAGRR